MAKADDLREGGLATFQKDGLSVMVKVVLVPRSHPNRPRERAIVEDTKTGKRFEVPVPALTPVVVTLPEGPP